jgi:hypothetical protein
MDFRAKLGVGVAACAVAGVGMSMFAPAAFAASGKLTQAQATSQLAAAGIGYTSSGGCTTRSDVNCTSLDQINTATVDDLIAFHRTSACTVLITGGTEVGHETSTYSHYNGYKVDLRLNTCINGFIRAHYVPIVPPTFGTEQYRDGSNIYTYEGNHWDVEYH